MNTQNNIQSGTKIYNTTADLTGKEGHVAKLVNGGNGKAALALPTAATDLTALVITEVESANSAAATPLTPWATARVRLSGTCNPGDAIGLAAGANLGKATKVTAAGARFIGVAEESGVDGQLLLIRPLNGTL